VVSALSFFVPGLKYYRQRKQRDGERPGLLAKGAA
jgi:hypothetical protein